MCRLMISESFLLMVVEKAERISEKDRYHLIMQSAFSAYKLPESSLTSFLRLRAYIAVSILRSNKNYVLAAFYCREQTFSS